MRRSNYPPAAFGVPVVLNPGVKERGHAQFNGAWTGSLQFFEQFRSKGAPVAFAPDPFSSHDCRNSRLLAIPFFDACLRAAARRDQVFELVAGQRFADVDVRVIEFEFGQGRV